MTAAFRSMSYDEVLAPYGNEVRSIFEPQLLQFEAAVKAFDYGVLARIDSHAASGWMWGAVVDQGLLLTMLRVKMKRAFKLVEQPAVPYSMIALASEADMAATSKAGKACAGRPKKASWNPESISLHAPLMPGLDKHVFAARMTAGRYQFPLEAGQVHQTSSIMLLDSFLQRNPQVAAAFEGIPSPCPLDSSLEVRAILQSLTVRHAAMPGAELYYRGKACEVLGAFASHRHEEAKQGGRRTQADEDLVSSAKSIIAETLESPVGLDELASRLYVGRTHLCEAFKRETGQSVGAYRSLLRMRKAEELLAYTDESIDDIARSAGFKHRSSLCASFRRTNGMSPSAWREKHARA